MATVDKETGEALLKRAWEIQVEASDVPSTNRITLFMLATIMAAMQAVKEADPIHNHPLLGILPEADHELANYTMLVAMAKHVLEGGVVASVAEALATRPGEWG